jgi:hypothetical protein
MVWAADGFLSLALSAGSISRFFISPFVVNLVTAPTSGGRPPGVRHRFSLGEPMDYIDSIQKFFDCMAHHGHIQCYRPDRDALLLREVKIEEYPGCEFRLLAVRPVNNWSADAPFEIRVVKFSEEDSKYADVIDVHGRRLRFRGYIPGRGNALWRRMERWERAIQGHADAQKDWADVMNECTRMPGRQENSSL